MPGNDMKKPLYDNQGRNLDAVKAHFDMLARHRVEGAAHAHALFETTVAKFPLADWVMFDNVLVLRAGTNRTISASEEIG